MPNGSLFQRCQVYDEPPFFSKTYMIDPIFLDWYIKGPTFLMYCGICTYVLFREFLRLLVLLVFNELTAIFV